MINPQAVRIKRRTVRKTGVGLCDACRDVVCPVGQRIRVQIRLHSRNGTLARTEVWDRRKQCLWQAKPKTFVGKEEERPVVQKRSANCSPEIILPFLSFGERRAIDVTVEPIAGVKDIISEIVECRTVKLIRTGTRYNRDLPSRCTPKFWRVG